MEEETLDQILLEQLHAAKNGHKLIKRLKKLIKNDPGVDALEHQNKIRIEFFENMIQDKDLLKKKNKKKRKKQSDLLSRNPVYEAYRFALFVTILGYNTMTDNMKNYFSFFKKENNENKNIRTKESSRSS